jgi:hypothetical protein
LLTRDGSGRIGNRQVVYDSRGRGSCRRRNRCRHHRAHSNTRALYTRAVRRNRARTPCTGRMGRNGWSRHHPDPAPGNPLQFLGIEILSGTRRRPPQMVRRPCSMPLSRLSGARPTAWSISRRLSRPSSGNSASKVRHDTGPTPGTLRSKSSGACHSGGANFGIC